MGSSAPGQFEHLVLLSPYFMSLSEVTVGQFRSSGVSSAPLGRWSGSSSGDSDADYCTYTDAPGPHEGMPLNCVPWDAARAYCQAMGGDLPTEAQYEYAARGLKSYNFVWGRDPPSCEDTVFGRVGYGMFEDRAASCKPDIPPGGPLPAGSGRRDRLALTGSEIVDLVGNVSEFCLDYFQEVQGPFWGTPMLFEDPRCDDPDLEPSRVAVGTNWGWSNADRVAHTRGRWPEPTPALSTMIGFRCVRPG
jgi:formylglycine-generating enzyme required for sulfatase activity